MRYIIPLVVILLISSCDTAKQKAKEVVNKSGQIVGEAGAEFSQGVAKGVETTFTNQLIFSEALTKSGLRAGKVTVSSQDSATDNILTVYMIFGQDFEGSVTAKVFSADSLEYGRAKVLVKGKKDDAHYVDFVFDKRTNIDSKGKLILE